MASATELLQQALSLHRTGQLSAAAELYGQILRADEGNAEVHNLLGTALAQQNRWDESIASFERALRLIPSSADFAANCRQATAMREFDLANTLTEQGQLAEAVTGYRRTLDMRPDFVVSHHNLGAVLARQESWEEAIACFRRAIELKPDYIHAHQHLATILAAQHQLVEAAECWRRVVALEPASATAHLNLGAMLDKQDKLDEAEASLRRACELDPTLVEAHVRLGVIASDRARFSEATAHWSTALTLEPKQAEVHRHWAVMLQRQGRTEEAIGRLRQALEIDPQLAGAQSDLLYAAQYQEGATLASLAAAHKVYQQHFAAPLRATWRAHENTPDPERPLRLGFVSADFGMHPVGYFLVRPLEHLDRRQFEIWCYDDRLRGDALQDRLRAVATQWRQGAMNDERLAAQIRADRIDILFDLAGHTANNRMLMFARKPAPIQISWIGYEGSTGLEAIDYLLADRHEIPQAAEPFISERVLRLPDGCFCFDPPASAPPVSRLPALSRGAVTFASFNNPAKLTAEVIALWAEVLRRIDGSRLMLKYRWLDLPEVGGRIERMFAENGIDRSRFDLLGWSPHADMLALYDHVDLALDPFPFNGGVTTCDALWMGVPVITWPGETFASRHSLSHLSNVGLTETIAADRRDYVEIAARLAGDLPRLAAIRGRLRQQMAASPMCDGGRFAEGLSPLLRDVWRRWCNAPSHE
jgi:predicted O-linked N-acetylglucosamine transferase (SPINDLY family)